MNHLEQLVSEWLQYNNYFVRVSVPVGPRPKGGFEGELDVVGIHPGKGHLIHIECSLDAASKEKREAKFSAKFERGRRFAPMTFAGLPEVTAVDQVAVLMLAGDDVKFVGGVRVIRTTDLILEINKGLAHTSPQRGAVPSNLPLLRTLQMAVEANRRKASPEPRFLITPTSN
jgi:hypothetical protein